MVEDAAGTEVCKFWILEFRVLSCLLRLVLSAEVAPKKTTQAQSKITEIASCNSPLRILCFSASREFAIKVELILTLANLRREIKTSNSRSRSPSHKYMDRPKFVPYAPEENQQVNLESCH